MVFENLNEKKMMFEKTRFGSITISGKKYKHDLYLNVDGNFTKRDKSHSERIDGHRELSKWEIENIIQQNPEVLIIGMGQSGVLPMSQETESWLESTLKDKQIQLIKERTPLILDKVNNLIREGKKVAGIFHTTC
jgi:hypothetical protein